MAAAVELRDNFTAAELRRLTQSRRNAGQVRQLLALAVSYDVGSRAKRLEAVASGL